MVNYYKEYHVHERNFEKIDLYIIIKEKYLNKQGQFNYNKVFHILPFDHY